jgi:ABC-2 type transport system ATP-binding protein
VFGEVIGDLADRGTSVFVTTHDLRAIEGIADHVAILQGGRLVLCGSLEALKAERGLTLEQIFAVVAGTRAADAVAPEVLS